MRPKGCVVTQRRPLAGLEQPSGTLVGSFRPSLIESPSGSALIYIRHFDEALGERAGERGNAGRALRNRSPRKGVRRHRSGMDAACRIVRVRDDLAQIDLAARRTQALLLGPGLGPVSHVATDLLLDQ